MTKQEYKNSHEKITQLIDKEKVKDAINLLLSLASKLMNKEYEHELHQINENYKYLLKYAIEGVQDPQRQSIYKKIRLKLYGLTDKILSEHAKNTENLYHQDIRAMRKSLKPISATQLDEAIKLSQAAANDDEKSRQAEDAFNNLFIYFWLIDSYSNNAVLLCKKLIFSDSVFWAQKCTIVSAITLSLIRYFDAAKLNLLLDIYEKAEDQVWQRALVGLFIGLNIYEKRILLDDGLTAKIKALEINLKNEENIREIYIQFIRAKETEKITKRIREEIIPEVAKITPKIIEKLDLDNIVGENFSEDKNPEWENMFEDSPDLFEKMGELSKMQIEGSDVFMGTFSMLKQFPFFKKLHNWFLPFYGENNFNLSNLKTGTIFDRDKFIASMKNVPFLCNSDKYSFCFNIRYLPEVQKSMLSNLFLNELNEMNEIAEDEKKLNQTKHDQYIFIQYIQDLYRFFKLHTYKDSLADIFELPLDFYKSELFSQFVTKSRTLRKIAEFYFEKNQFSEAVDVYKKLIDDGFSEYEIFQKTGFCLQKQKRYKEALDFYFKGELFDKNKVWNLKKTAFCLMKLNKHEEALEYYLKAEKLEPENLSIQANVGRCYLNLKQYENALKYYFKLEYLSPSNIKVQRPLAWCSFVLGKYDNAQKYLQKVIEKEGNKHDFMNLGHIELCRGNKTKAIEHYVKSLNEYEKNLEVFFSEFDEDREVLKNRGISTQEINDIAEYIRFFI